MANTERVILVVQPWFDNSRPLNNSSPDLEYRSMISISGSGEEQPISFEQSSEISQEKEEKKTHWSAQTGEGKQWDVYLGNAKTVLETFPENAYQCVVTSPPYFWLRDYGIEGQIGKEWKVDDYIQAIADVMDEVRRTLAPEGVLFLNIGDTYYSGKGQSKGIDRKSRKRRFGLRAVDASGLGLPQKSLIGIPWRLALKMIDHGWVLRSSIIWDRLNTLPESVQDRPGRTYEYVFMFVKNRKYYFNRQALNGQRDDVWTIKARPRPTPGISTAPYPDELVQKCLDIGCPKEGKVLDPFAGSGTTLRVALQSGRDAIGIDIHPSFCEYMARELSFL